MASESSAIRFVTFNVCGLKTILNSYKVNASNEYESLFQSLDGDVICLQETKLQVGDLTRSLALAEGYDSFFTFSSLKKGYSGIAFFVRSTIGVLKAEEGLTGWLSSGRGKPAYRELNENIGGYPDIDRKKGLVLDGEGRCILLDLGACVVIGVYCPATSTETRAHYRDKFYRLLDYRIRSLMLKGREIVLLGDLNEVMEARDSAEDTSRASQVSLLHDQLGLSFVQGDEVLHPRNIVQRWIVGEKPLLNDTTRLKNMKRERMFTCWNQKLNARPSNFGSRLDYILSTPGLDCIAADIVPSLKGSDHCPVYAVFYITAEPPRKALSLSTKRSFGTDGHIKTYFCKGDAIPSIQQPTTRASDQSVTSSRKSLQMTLKPFLKRAPAGAQSLWMPEQQRLLSKDSGVSNAWQNVFRRSIPRCYHNEDCKLMTTKKSGPNKGRAFWTCDRPFGAETDKEARCKFFIWDSETRNKDNKKGKFPDMPGQPSIGHP